MMPPRMTFFAGDGVPPPPPSAPSPRAKPVASGCLPALGMLLAPFALAVLIAGALHG